MCKEKLLVNILEGKDLDELLKHNIIKISEWFGGIVTKMGISKVPFIKIELENKYLDFMNLVLEGKNMGFYHDKMMESYLINDRNFTKVNMIAKAIDSLLECINYAIKLESTTITKHDQSLLEGIVNDTAHTQTNFTLTNKEYISSFIYGIDMSLVRENIRFKEIENLLNKLKQYVSLLTNIAKVYWLLL